MAAQQKERESSTESNNQQSPQNKMPSAISTPNTEMKDRLIASVKKEVKQLMEQAVAKKLIHEDSGAVTSLSGAVEACLGQGLRRRALGLFKTGSTTALLHKIAKHCPEAAIVSRRVLECEGDTSLPTATRSASGAVDRSGPPPLRKRGSAGGLLSGSSQQSVSLPKYLWIRLALFDRHLARIIDHLVSNAIKYYDKDSLVADRDYGTILSSLLVGPCALEYTRAKTIDVFWSDPPADELVQRHRISASTNTPPSCRHPINYKRSLNASSDDGSSSSIGGSLCAASCAKDYVESLHQNNRATLLYGKNNVQMQPKDASESLPGYLSLHQTPSGLVIKWTPNQLMNGYSESEIIDKSIYWAMSLQLNVNEIVYVHVHEGSDVAMLILVGQDGVQRPPILFPQGGHLLAFLNCLENGLLPNGQLDPPLWSQKGSGKVFPGAGKVRKRPLPRVLERDSSTASDRDTVSEYVDDDLVKNDYVFRIVDRSNVRNPHDMVSASETAVTAVSAISAVVSACRRAALSSSSTASSDSTLSSDTPAPVIVHNIVNQQRTNQQSTSIALVCDTMRRQIISRAFYGWLAYCRHLSTVRTHLSGLVHFNIIDKDNCEGGLSKEKWKCMTDEQGAVHEDLEVNRLVYYGGCDHDIRREVWPYLLEYYRSTAAERMQRDLETRRAYENTMSEWLCVEAIVRQRDKEATAASMARLNHTLVQDEVFEDNSIISDDPPIASPEASDCDRRTQNPDQSRPLLSREPTIDDVDNIDVDTENPSCSAEELTNGSCRVNPDARRESIAEIKRLAEEIVQKGDGRGPLCSVESMGESNVVHHHSVIVTNPSVDMAATGSPHTDNAGASPSRSPLGVVQEEVNTNCASFDKLDCQEKDPSRSNCVSPASSNGGVYSNELVESFALNLHRIEKDVQRCDRNYYYFTNENLDKLRNIMCTYVWEHLDCGYMQGMCDLCAPLLVIMGDEAISHAMFALLMDRARDNFPSGNSMDDHFSNMRSLIQILDAEMYELMDSHGDYTHFYFCYRWFLLDFKRELLYQDVFAAWEMIWAARKVASEHMVLFIALAMLETYRDIILANSMDFTDIIKFFNEMAERHDAKALLSLARDLVLQVQTLIENK